MANLPGTRLTIRPVSLNAATVLLVSKRSMPHPLLENNRNNYARPLQKFHSTNPHIATEPKNPFSRVSPALPTGVILTHPKESQPNVRSQIDPSEVNHDGTITAHHDARSKLQREE